MNRLTTISLLLTLGVLAPGTAAVQRAGTAASTATDTAAPSPADVAPIDRWSAAVDIEDYATAVSIASQWVREIERRDGVTAPALFKPLQRYASALEAQGAFAQAQVFY